MVELAAVIFMIYVYLVYALVNVKRYITAETM